MIASQPIGQRWDFKAFVHKNVAISGKIQGLSHCPHPAGQDESGQHKSHTDFSLQSPTRHAISKTNREGTQPYLVIVQN